MKAIYFIVCFFILGAQAVVNQNAQRREAPQKDYGAPPQGYGPPRPNPPPVRQQNIMQRLVAAMTNGGYAGQQARVVNRPRPIPISQPPQNSYGPPKQSYGAPHVGGGSSSQGSLANFMNSHSPDVRCDGWVPIPGPSVGGEQHSSGGSAGSISSIDNSYGPPSQGHQSDSISSIGNSYGPPSQVHQSGSVSSIDSSYGPPRHGSGNIGLNTQVSDSYGPPSQGHQSGSVSSIDSSYGPPRHGSGNSGLNTQIIDSYVPPPQPAYGAPDHVSSGFVSQGHSSGSSGFVSQGHSSGSSSGFGSQTGQQGIVINVPDDSYGPPAPVYNHNVESHSSGGSVSSGDSSYSPPANIGHATYGPPDAPAQEPITSYGAPASGHSEAHGDVRHSSQGHASEIQTIHSGPGLQLPSINSGPQFNSAIGLVASSLGVAAGHNEVVQSHAIHESHTSEVLSNNANGGDSYSAPPLDSYAPGKYSPTFLKPQPQQHLPPAPPVNTYLPQRLPPAPRPLPPPQQYIPPIPQKLNRPQPPPFRPQFNSHAQSVAQGYASGHSQSQSNYQQQSVHGNGNFRQQPRNPLINRPPVPQGLFQSIGNHVQALDNANRPQISSSYLPSTAPAQQFLSQHQQHSSGGSASSSAAYSFQNQELRNVHIIHDCGKGPQLAQGGYAAPSQNYGAPQPQQSYAAPQPQQAYGAPKQSYGIPLGEPLKSYEPISQVEGLSSNYEVPRVNLEVPQQNSIDFNSNSNSYGPPASGPAALDVIGLESQQRVNTFEEQNIVSAGVNTENSNEGLPGLSGGLSGLNFISAQKSHSIDVPAQGSQLGQYQLQFATSHSDQGSNSVDSPNHQQILADGLLQSILTAIEQKPIHAVPQVTEDLETDHSEVKVFLTSPKGQEVLKEQPAVAADEHHSS